MPIYSNAIRDELNKRFFFQDMLGVIARIHHTCPERCNHISTTRYTHYTLEKNDKQKKCINSRRSKKIELRYIKLFAPSMILILYYYYLFFSSNQSVICFS